MRLVIVTAIALPLIALAFLGAGYVHDEVVSDDRVSRGVEAVGIDLSRLPEENAASAIATYEQTLVGQPVELIIDGHAVQLDPAAVGLTVDEAAVAADAMAVRREAGFANVTSWLGTFTSSVTVDVPVTYDEEALRALLAEWSLTKIDKPAYEGAVRIESGQAVPEYPRAGLMIDADAAVPLIGQQLVTPDREVVEVPLEPLEPIVQPGDVDVAVVKANKLIDTAVTLRRPGVPKTLIITPDGLASALRSEVVVNSPATVEVSLDEEILRGIAERQAEAFVIPPVDATFSFDDETKTLSIVPSIPGQRVDVEAIPEAVTRAALSSGTGALPMTTGEEAAFTTAMAEAMGPLGEVSTFTTYHPCCASRVRNIQLLADEIRGAIVMPGEEFSINQHAGKRTIAEGYVRAGAIINGRVECCDSAVNIGGGTSQFATTFYNAVFFGCYEDVFHQPHSLYFSRYPFVREATLGYPLPDVIFRNDSEAIVYIDTSYTGGSITVTFYGNNGGRECTAERSGNTVTRIMEWPDGKVTTQEWTWNYRKPRPKDPEPTTTTTAPEGETTTTTAPEGGTTTTTAPPETTTTTAPETTTTTAPETTTTTSGG
ncbi:MAG: VanW family protein [Acidimicrobiia bacterium]|nr:VanW family protein [Acidimicrobiia bacterium]